MQIELALDHWPDEGDPPMREIYKALDDDADYLRYLAEKHRKHNRSLQYTLDVENIASLGWRLRGAYMLGRADNGDDLFEITNLEPCYAGLRRVE